VCVHRWRSARERSERGDQRAIDGGAARTPLACRRPGRRRNGRRDGRIVFPSIAHRTPGWRFEQAVSPSRTARPSTARAPHVSYCEGNGDSQRLDCGA
jgi:hypothetical protein